MTLEAYRRSHPHVAFLSADEPDTIADYLRGIGVLDESEAVNSIERAGDGNMNLTLRVRTSDRSLIVKQSRPWVERYPSIDAPWDRVLSEARFYYLASAHPEVAGRLPRLIEVDVDARVMVVEDLGASRDYSGLYDGERLDPDVAGSLAQWLGVLHGVAFHERSRASLVNRGMLTLNHEHIFSLPLDPQNDLDLDAITPGLRAAAERVAADTDYCERVARLGDRYLGKGDHEHDVSLLHGDFFPGSWLRTDNGPAVIDPEFAFFGPREFDVGVFFAHLYLTKQDDSVHAAVAEGYLAGDGFDWSEAHRYAGVEIMRRLVGVAQLPLVLGLDEKQRLLTLSRELVLGDRGPAA